MNQLDAFKLVYLFMTLLYVLLLKLIFFLYSYNQISKNKLANPITTERTSNLVVGFIHTTGNIC